MIDCSSCRVRRGGSWLHCQQDVQSPVCIGSAPNYQNCMLGVRLVEVLRDPELPSLGGSSRTLRGGSQYEFPQSARVPHRNRNNPGIRDMFLGIRIVEVVEDPEAKRMHPHVPRNHRIAKGGSWRFRSGEFDRSRAFPKPHTLENLGIRLVEEVTDV